MPGVAVVLHDKTRSTASTSGFLFLRVDDRQKDVRRVNAVAEDLIVGRLGGAEWPTRPAGMGVHIKAGIVAAGDGHPDAMVFIEHHAG